MITNKCIKEKVGLTQVEPLRNICRIASNMVWPSKKKINRSPKKER